MDVPLRAFWIGISSKSPLSLCFEPISMIRNNKSRPDLIGSGLLHISGIVDTACGGQRDRHCGLK
jgi:hypothetical protein